MSGEDLKGIFIDCTLFGKFHKQVRVAEEEEGSEGGLELTRCEVTELEVTSVFCAVVKAKRTKKNHKKIFEA